MRSLYLFFSQFSSLLTSYLTGIDSLKLQNQHKYNSVYYRLCKCNGLVFQMIFLFLLLIWDDVSLHILVRPCSQDSPTSASLLIWLQVCSTTSSKFLFLLLGPIHMTHHFQYSYFLNLFEYTTVYQQFVLPWPLNNGQMYRMPFNVSRLENFSWLDWSGGFEAIPQTQCPVFIVLYDGWCMISVSHHWRCLIWSWFRWCLSPLPIGKLYFPLLHLLKTPSSTHFPANWNSTEALGTWARTANIVKTTSQLLFGGMPWHRYQSLLQVLPVSWAFISVFCNCKLMA